MTTEDLIKLSNNLLLSFGGGAIIIFALSNWLGKIWANRLMQKERNEYSRELEKLRSDLAKENEKELSRLKANIDIFKEKHLQGHTDKISIYRLVVDVVSNVLGDFDLMEQSKNRVSNSLERWDQFNRGRMQAYGYLAMLAPQEVMDATDALFDHLICISQGQALYEWSTVRNHILKLLNEVRRDIGLNVDPIEYRGKL